jgi:hypothetical protein
MRTCSTCQHLKRPEIDRRLAAGEPLAPLAQEHGVSASSLYRHRKNCLGLGASNDIKKEAARGSAASALLPSAASLSEGYGALRNRIDEIVAQAQKEGSLRVALAGLTSLRQTLDSQARLATRDALAKDKKGGHGTGGIDARDIAERLIQKFDQRPDVKADLAAALAEIDDEERAASAPAAVDPKTMPPASTASRAPTDAAGNAAPADKDERQSPASGGCQPSVKQQQGSAPPVGPTHEGAPIRDAAASPTDGVPHDQSGAGPRDAGNAAAPPAEIRPPTNAERAMRGSLSWASRQATAGQRANLVNRAERGATGHQAQPSVVQQKGG